MTAVNQTIVTAYEVCGLSPEEIAAQEDLEVESVKAVLLQFSMDYRKNTTAVAVTTIKPSVEEDTEEPTTVDPEPEISPEEYKTMWDAYKQLALYSEVDAVRERALRFALEEKKGRNSARIRALAGASGNKNVLLLNQVLRKVKQINGNSESKEKPALPKIIDVECLPQKTQTKS